MACRGRVHISRFGGLREFDDQALLIAGAIRVEAGAPVHRRMPGLPERSECDAKRTKDLPGVRTMTEQEAIDVAVDSLKDIVPVEDQRTIAQQLEDNLSLKISGGVPPTEIKVEDHFTF